ncbi:secondary thiamine-phosphate synthase enzyme [Desulfomonile tiedjei DSM 6799]|uniref:Secondary thiamine-phosphate synthase enzyme n=2 Tax=Desulfomonile tiedjei TaxID=2358 RepID=I4C8V9_DESTA|nr:secondary thiamine-phosphate synthase enzyme YjbQ [Desulfomonile tiedjei]AFM26000.1 secondary thiamine-phosphate synthase enzyme [Desulfomonile tiedjei DSM 6799]
METFEVKSNGRVQFLDITSRVRDTISASGVQDGLAIVFVPHTTAGVTINEAADPSVAQDIQEKLGKLVPHSDSYRHAEGNSDAHIKASIVGSSVTIIIADGKPVLGTWQGVFFCEFDGPRSRKVFVRIVAA